MVAKHGPLTIRLCVARRAQVYSPLLFETHFTGSLAAAISTRWLLHLIKRPRPAMAARPGRSRIRAAEYWDGVRVELSGELGSGRGHEGEDRDQADANQTVVVTGPGGAAWSPDEGATWFVLPGVANYWAVAFGSPKTGWFVGTDGRILRIDF